MVHFFKYLIVWISQNLAVPFWMVGHVHLSMNIYEDIYEVLASFGMNILVAVGFIINYLEEKKVMKTEKRKAGRPRKVVVENPVNINMETVETAMLKEVDKFIFNIIHHCSEVESRTGKITLRDVDYSVNLLKRILEHKYKNSSKEN